MSLEPRQLNDLAGDGKATCIPLVGAGKAVQHPLTLLASNIVL
jgi:hypothetical protein